MGGIVLYATPHLTPHDRAVLAEIDDIRAELAHSLRAPRRWTGGLRRSTQARAIRGSNSIEGYDVTPEDAAAAVDGEEPMTVDERTWKEIEGYRRVLTYVLRMAAYPGFRPDAQTLCTMHFMLLEHDLDKWPGRYRPGSIYVQDEKSGANVYEGPDSDDVAGLMGELSVQLTEPSREVPAMVRAAMAHLNMVMIHPFRDGNGRMARVVQTLVLAGDDIVEPEFSSIEEWLGANTEDYYAVLEAVGRGQWNPHHDATLWLLFCLRAHHQQAQTLRRRFREAERVWASLDALIEETGVPERAVDALFDASLGMRLQRSGYVSRVGVEERTATRDFSDLVAAGLLEPRGSTRGRHYVAGARLMAAVRDARGDRTLVDPYPTLMSEIHRVLAEG